MAETLLSESAVQAVMVRPGTAEGKVEGLVEVDFTPCGASRGGRHLLLAVGCCCDMCFFEADVLALMAELSDGEWCVLK